MCDGPNIVRSEGLQDLEGRREDSHEAIVAAKKEVLRARADTADLVVLEE